MKKNRRIFLKNTGLITAGLLSSGSFLSCEGRKQIIDQTEVDAMDDLFFKISLAQWSFNRSFFSGELDHLDFADKARSVGLGAIEYVNRFFQDKAEDMEYLSQMNTRADDADVRQLLIMIDGEGNLGNTNEAERIKAVENHYKWINAAKELGCHSIRVNAYGDGSREDVASAAVDGLARLSEYASGENIHVLVENHGSWSSDGQWLMDVMNRVGMDNCGTLPDFGNFCIKRGSGELYSGNCVEEYDRYKGVDEMMPKAKAVSAKAHQFDENGNEVHTDFLKMMKIVKDHGYNGYVGIEYEGAQLGQEEGVIATRDLLIKVGKQLS